MKKILYLFIAVLMFANVHAQNVTITPGGITPAMSGTYPRISYEAILALPSPQTGDQAFDITYNCMRIYIQGKWLCSHQDLQNYTPNMLAIASAGGINFDYGEDIAHDANGNIYVTGYFTNIATFGGTSVSSQGSFDVFVAKYNKYGTLQWVRSGGGTNTDLAYSIALDGTGNVYITGKYSGSATFGATTITSLGNSDIFVAKYNNAGTLQWVQSAGGTVADDGISIAADGSGNAYITGTYSGSATFGGTILNSQGNSDIFVAKYNTSGVLQWAKSAGGTGSDIGLGIALDNNGNVHITGRYSGSVMFEATPLTSHGGFDIFVAKYNNSGSLQWVKSAGGINNDESSGIDIDDGGNVFIIGKYAGTSLFGLDMITSEGNTDVFVAKCDNSGTWQWVQSVGGTGEDIGQDIAIENNGNVYITGNYSGTALFNSIPKTTKGSFDVFVAKFNSAGNFEWVQSAGGGNTDYGTGITVDGSGNVYAVGYYSDTSFFGRNSKTSQGGNDIFIVMLDK